MNSILVVDDKDLMRESVMTTLERAGFSVRGAIDAATALSAIAEQRPDVVVTDMRMPGMTGIELIERINQIDDELPVVLMTAFGTIDTAVQAMRLGAFDYLTKPFEGDELIITIKRAVEHRRIRRENALLRVVQPQAPVSRLQGVGRLIGTSPAMQTLREEIEAIAGSSGTVLITGESGVGKEVVSRALHETSPRGEGSFLAVNCAALSESLLESELFGHERGAFTGAERQRKGRFELADGGTLLLDEISEVSPAIQAKLLRVLQERAFERVGSSITIGVDVRVVCTSNRDLPLCVQRGEFRQDLYFRLNVLPIRVPSLRERAEDVPLLAEHFIAQVCAREGRSVLGLESRTAQVMMNYAWPGNVRELQNICERAVVLSSSIRNGAATSVRHELIEGWLASSASVLPAREGTQLSARNISNASGETLPTAEMMPTQARPSMAELVVGNTGNNENVSKPSMVLEDLERGAILDALERFGGHRQRTADALGIGVRTLGLKIKKWKEQGVLSRAA